MVERICERCGANHVVNKEVSILLWDAIERRRRITSKLAMMRRKHGVDVRASFHARTSNPRTVGGTSNQIRFLSRRRHCHTRVEIIPGRISGGKGGLEFMLLNSSGLLQSTSTPPRDKIEQQLSCSRAMTVEPVPFQLKSK